MDSLINKDNLMRVPSDLFLAQAFIQGNEGMANGLSALLDVQPVALPMVQTYKALAANTSRAAMLTARELEILELLGTGLSVKGVARELDISPGTVKWHIKNLYYKLSASSREDALSKARLRKII